MFQGELGPEDVKDGKTFARFCQQRYGTPYPTGKGLMILNKQAKTLFEEHPDVDWKTLVDVAQWCHGKKRRVGQAYQYVTQFRWAYADGAIKLTPTAELAVRGEITHALEHETDPEWRERIIRADGVDAQRAILELWRKERVEVVG